MSPRRPTSRRWLWPLLLGIALQTFAWNVCLPFLPLRIRDLGVGDLGQVARQAGFLVGISSLLNTALATPWSWVGARFGYRKQVLRAHAGTALGWTLMGLARTPQQLGAAAVALGGLSGNYPHYVALAAARALPNQIGQAIGDMQAASQIGQTLGPLLGGLVASQLGTQPTFFVSAVFSLTAVAMALAFIPSDAGRTAATATSATAAATATDAVTSTRGPAANAPSGGIATAWRQPAQRRLMAILLLGDAGIIGLRPLIPVVLSARIADPSVLAATTGVTTTLATAGTILAAIVVGRIARWIAPGRLLAITLPIAALCVALIPFVAGVPTLITLWTVSGLASGATTPAVFAWLGRLSPASPSTGAGTGTSTGTAPGTGGYTLLANTSMATYALGPLVMGQVSAASLSLPFFLGALAAGTAALATFFPLTTRLAPRTAPATSA